VNFKNFIHTDESLRLTALLFPSIKEISFEGNLLSIAGVQHIAMSCNKLKHIEFYECSNLNISNAFALFNTEDHKEHLERIFVHAESSCRSSDNAITIDGLPFMALCDRCQLYYNQLKNEKEMLCLYHPGVSFSYLFL